VLILASDTLLTKVSKRTTLYLIIYLICELPGLINRLEGYIAPDRPLWWLYLIQVLGQGAEGFLNAAVYGMRYWRHWKCATFFRSWLFCE